MDVEAAQILVKGQDDDAFFDLIVDELDKTYVDTWSWANICLNLTTKANIICFSTGLGDGG